MEQVQATYCLSNITIESIRQDFKEWRNNKTTRKILRTTMEQGLSAAQKHPHEHAGQPTKA